MFQHALKYLYLLFLSCCFTEINKNDDDDDVILANAVRGLPAAFRIAVDPFRKQNRFRILHIFYQQLASNAQEGDQRSLNLATP